jgi:hypothetical protein
MRKKGVPLPVGIYSLNRAFGYLEWLEKTAELSRELGSFLTNAFPHPDHFVTLTLRDLLHRGKRVQLGFIALNRAWEIFYHHTRIALGHRFEFVYVTEPQARGVPHIPALTWGTKELQSEDNEVEMMIQDRCWNLFGQSCMAPFDPRQNAGEYVAKYLFRGGTEKRVSTSSGLRQLATRARRRLVHTSGNVTEKLKG